MIRTSNDKSFGSDISSFESNRPAPSSTFKQMKYFIVTGQASLSAITLTYCCELFPSLKDLTELLMEAYKVNHVGTVPTKWAILMLIEVTQEEFRSWNQ